jgi:hypothetical protein
MMDSNADSTYSSLIAMPDWLLLLAIVEAADSHSHRGDPPVFPVSYRARSTETSELAPARNTIAAVGAKPCVE